MVVTIYSKNRNFEIMKNKINRLSLLLKYWLSYLAKAQYSPLKSLIRSQSLQTTSLKKNSLSTSLSYPTSLD